MQIDIDVVGLGRTAPCHHLDDARNRQQAALQDPVLQRAEIGQPEVRRTDQLVPENLAYEARALDRRLHVVRKSDALLKIDRRLRVGKVVIDAVVEHHPDERKAVERGRANDVHSRRRGETDLHRNGVIALHLFGRQAGRLGRYFEDDGCRVRISLDVEFRESGQPAHDQHRQGENDERTPGEGECEQGFQHCAGAESPGTRPTAKRLTAMPQ